METTAVAWAQGNEGSSLLATEQTAIAGSGNIWLDRIASHSISCSTWAWSSFAIEITPDRRNPSRLVSRPDYSTARPLFDPAHQLSFLSHVVSLPQPSQSNPALLRRADCSAHQQMPHAPSQSPIPPRHFTSDPCSPPQRPPLVLARTSGHPSTPRSVWCTASARITT